MVLGQMLNSGSSLDSIAPLLAVARKAVRANEVEEEEPKAKDKRRCKWWNRGFCRDKVKCSFRHPIGDCQDHLQGGCTTRGCITLRHRKVCKFLKTETGCLRGEECEYLHVQENELVEKRVDKEKENKFDTKKTCVKICRLILKMAHASARVKLMRIDL